MVKIYDVDTPQEIAKKIYEQFDVMASCSVYGFVVTEEKIIPKGELVLQEIKRLDELENISYFGKKKVRKYKYRKDSIGGTLAQKIFTWEKRIVDSEPRYTIWRFQ